MIDHDDPRVYVALLMVGGYYRWGGGHPCTLTIGDNEGLQAAAFDGLDCSGSVIAYATVLGAIVPGSIDTTAHGLAMRYLDEVSAEDAEPGDFTIYDRNQDHIVEHIAVYIGDGMEVTVSGGGRNTHGDDPQARCQVRPVKNPLCFARWKPEYVNRR